MDLRKIFNCLIAFSVAAGLLLAPMSAPAMAASHPAAVADEMQAMADDMPCCPSQQDQKAKDCRSCPFVALCTLTITPPLLTGNHFLVERHPSREVFSLPNDLPIDGLGEHPPDQPPRMNV